MKTKRPIGIDLFAGAGGLSLGFEQAGFDVVAAVEIDPIHCAIHEYNFPECKTICRDVKKIGGKEIRLLAGIGNRDVDVVFGGAPCQGFSMIGKRALDDSRNELVYHFVRLILDIRPKHFIFENVKGLTVGKHKKFLEETMTALEDGGYVVQRDYRVLNARDYGVPQDRKRLFLLGSRANLPLPEYPLPLPAETTVAQAIGDLPEAEKFHELSERDWTDRAKYGRPSVYAKRMRCIERDTNDFGYTRKFDRDVLTSSLRSEHSELSKSRFAKTKWGETEPVSRFHKLDPHGVCNTLRAGTASDRGAFTSPRPIHPYTPRCITVREAARLHSYPDWFRFHATKWHGFRQIGNSVPPLLGRAVAAKIMQALSEIPRVPTHPVKLGDEKLLTLNMSDASKKFDVSSDVIPKRKRAADDNDKSERMYA